VGLVGSVWFWLRKMMAKGILVITTFLNELVIPGLRYTYLHFAVMLESHWPVKTLTNVLDVDNAAEKYYSSYAYRFVS
jgi:hypothetical protein